MSYKAQLFNGNQAEWAAYVAGHEHATAYHLLPWREVIERSFGHRTYYLAVRQQGEGLAGILPLVYMKSGIFGKFLVSVPFVNYGGLLYDSPEAAEALLEEASYIMKGVSADHLELRHVAKYGERLATKQHKVTMVLPLADTPDNQWSRFDAKLRNQVRKAVKSNLQFHVGGGELINSFYRVFSHNMRDLGTPVYCRNFFQNIVAAFPDSTKVFLVTVEDRVIAAAVSLWHRDVLEIPWASSLREYRSLCPNNILYWEAIKFAINHHFKKFDFGRSTPGEGTYKFKEQWGAMPVSLHWQYLMREDRPLPELSPTNPKFRLAIKLWQKLPVTVANVLGPAIVRNIP